MRDKNNNSASGTKGRSLLLILLILIAFLACGLSGYLYWKLQLIPQQALAAEQVKEPSAPDPVYVPMSTFTVNLTPTANEYDRVLYIGITLRLADERSSLILQKFLPEYRSRLLMLFNKQTYEALHADEGKSQLINDIKNVLNETLSPNQPIQVTDVLINEFILR